MSKSSLYEPQNLGSEEEKQDWILKNRPATFFSYLFFLLFFPWWHKCELCPISSPQDSITLCLAMLSGTERYVSWPYPRNVLFHYEMKVKMHFSTR